MNKDTSESHQWEDEFDRKKKRSDVVKKTSEYKRKNKYKRDYSEDDY